MVIVSAGRITVISLICSRQIQDTKVAIADILLSIDLYHSQLEEIKNFYVMTLVQYPS